MAKIKITLGGAGIEYKDANGNARHALKTPEDGPFECDDAQAERLVGLHVAEYVNELGWRQVADNPAPQPDENPDATAPETEKETEKTTGHLDAEELAKMDYNDLKKLAADMGVTPKGKKKDDYIAALVAAEVEIGDKEDPDEDDDNDLPVLNAADPE